MAYSDYGGYAYKNGEHVIKRSDAVLSPEGLKSTPGTWPGWILPEGRGGGSYHVILGDGPIFVCLYKQSSLSIYKGFEKVDLLTLIDREAYAEAIKRWTFEGSNNEEYLDTDYFKETERPLAIHFEGCTITVWYREEDNHYLYVKLEQPDGTVWSGFSGYQVGAGLENEEGYSTEERINTLKHLVGSLPTESRQDDQA